MNEKGKVFIEYSPLDKAGIPVIGENYIYVYCLWVSESFKGKGYGKELMEYCIADAKTQGKSGVCMISSKKKKLFLSDKNFLEQFGFTAVDTAGEEYVLMALVFDGASPRFAQDVKKQTIDRGADLTIYYGLKCPYIPNFIEQIESYCKANYPSYPSSDRFIGKGKTGSMCF